nr:MAG TPA: hypothetical protein [Caudoviricetes sp.]
MASVRHYTFRTLQEESCYAPEQRSQVSIAAEGMHAKK